MTQPATNLAEELRAGHSIVTHTHGTSMRPLLTEGRTQVLVSPVNDEIRVGDIVLWKSGEGVYTLHRVIRIETNPGTIIVTRGDNSITCERVPAEEILGRVTQIIRGRTFQEAGSRPLRFYAALWRLTTPLRLPFLRIRGRLRRMTNR